MIGTLIKLSFSRSWLSTISFLAHALETKYHTIVSLSNGVFEQSRTSIGSGRFAFLGSGFPWVISLNKSKTLCNTRLEVSRHTKSFLVNKKVLCLSFLMPESNGDCHRQPKLLEYVLQK